MEQNIAIVTGEVSGVVAVDADSPTAIRWATRHLAYTPWQTQTSRGYHLLYQHPGSKIGNRAKIETGSGRLDLDVRGDGGLAMAPGSIHPSGVEYLRAGDWSVPLDRLPRFWVGWLRRPARAVVAPRFPNPSGDVVERARRYLAQIPRPEIGAGSDAATLYAACRIVRGFGVSESEATALLWEWAGGRPGWTHEWIAEKVRNALRFGSEPMGALR